MEKISVIIPVYNVAEYLERCLDSVLSQTYENLDIILVDDGSRDISGDICDRYARKDGRIRVFHTQNHGLSAARNRGIEEALGELLVFVDSDDMLWENLIRFLYDEMEKCGADIASAEYIRCGQDDALRDITQFGKEIREKTVAASRDRIVEALLKDEILGPMAWGKLYKKSLFEGIRYPEGKLHEDTYIAAKLFTRAKRILITGVCAYAYRTTNTGITTKVFSDRAFDRIRSTLSQLHFIERNYPAYSEYAASQMLSACNLTIFAMGRSKVYDKKALEHIRQLYRTYLSSYLKNPHTSLGGKAFALLASCDARKAYDASLAAGGIGRLAESLKTADGMPFEGRMGVRSARVYPEVEEPVVSVGLVSVVIPVYNDEKFLVQAVKSVLEQTYQDIEIILVDDGSKDRSREICERLAVRYDNISLITQERKGPGGARNAGIKKAQGNVIVFIDGDDMVFDYNIAFMAKLMQMTGADIVQSGKVRCRDDDRVRDLKYIRHKEDEHGTYVFRKADRMKAVVNGVVRPHCIAKLYKKDLFDDISFPEKMIQEDSMISFLLADKAETICVSQRPGYAYRLNPDSICNRPFTKNSLLLVKAKMDQYRFIKKNYPEFEAGAAAQVVTALNTTAWDMGIAGYRDRKTELAMRRLYKRFLSDYLRNWNVTNAGKLFACSMIIAMRLVLAIVHMTHIPIRVVKVKLEADRKKKP